MTTVGIQIPDSGKSWSSCCGLLTLMILPFKNAQISHKPDHCVPNLNGIFTPYQYSDELHNTVTVAQAYHLNIRCHNVRKYDAYCTPSKRYSWDLNTELVKYLKDQK